MLTKLICIDFNDLRNEDQNRTLLGYSYLFDKKKPGAAARLEACPLGKRPRVRSPCPAHLVMSKISTTILPLPLIQEEQFSVKGERMCTKYW